MSESTPTFQQIDGRTHAVVPLPARVEHGGYETGVSMYVDKHDRAFVHVADQHRTAADAYTLAAHILAAACHAEADAAEVERVRKAEDERVRKAEDEMVEKARYAYSATPGNTHTAWRAALAAVGAFDHLWGEQ